LSTARLIKPQLVELSQRLKVDSVDIFDNIYTAKRWILSRVRCL